MAKPDASSSTSSSSHGSGSCTNKGRQNKIEIDIQKPNMKYNHCESLLVNTSMTIPTVDSTRAHNRKEKERMRKTLRENAKRLKLLEEKMQSISSAVTTTNGTIEGAEDKTRSSSMIVVSDASSQVRVKPHNHRSHEQVSPSSRPVSSDQLVEGITAAGLANGVNTKIKLAKTDINMRQFNACNLRNVSNKTNIPNAVVMSQIRCPRVPESATRPSSMSSTPSSTPLQTPTQPVPPSNISTPGFTTRSQKLARLSQVDASVLSLSRNQISAPPCQSSTPVSPDLVSSESALAHSQKLILIPKPTTGRCTSSDANLSIETPKDMLALPSVPGTETKYSVPPNKISALSPTISSKNTNSNTISPVLNASVFTNKADHSLLTSPDSLDGFAGLQNGHSANADFSIHDLASASNSLDLNVNTGTSTKPTADTLLQLQGLPAFPLPTRSPRRPSWFGVPF